MTKEDIIIMKNRFRIFTSLILVTLLVTALASPAIASEVVNHESTGTVNGYSYYAIIYYTEIDGIAHIKTTGSPTTLRAQSQTYLIDEVNDLIGYSNVSDVTAYAAVSAGAGRYIPHDGYKFYSEVQDVYGKVYVQDVLVGANISVFYTPGPI